MNALLLLAPALGLLAAPLVHREADPRRARVVAVVAAASVFALALGAALFGPVEETLSGFDVHAWSGPAFALDGLSAPLFPFVAGVLLALVLGTPTRFLDPRALAGLLATGALFLGLLAARSPSAVALFWVLSSIPTALELRRHHGSRGFVAFRIVSTVLVALGVLLASLHGESAQLSGALVLIGVLVREGIFPFHAWVPRLFERAPLGTALLFVQPQIGAYVLARFVVTGPTGSIPLLFDVLGGITVLYGAALALAQTRTRRALGYLTVSQSALVLIGLADGGVLGATGALLVIIAVGLGQTGFGLALWALEARRGVLRLDVDGGGHADTPALAGATLMLGLATVGLPGTLAFVAEDLVFHATLEARPFVGVALVAATALNGISVLRIAFRLFGGRARATGERDLVLRERVVLGLLAAVLIAAGLLPQPLLTPARDALEHLGAPSGHEAAAPQHATQLASDVEPPTPPSVSAVSVGALVWRAAHAHSTLTQ